MSSTSQTVANAIIASIDCNLRPLEGDDFRDALDRVNDHLGSIWGQRAESAPAEQGPGGGTIEVVAPEDSLHDPDLTEV